MRVYKPITKEEYDQIKFQLRINYVAEGVDKHFEFPSRSFEAAITMLNAFVESFKKLDENLFYITTVVIDEE